MPGQVGDGGRGRIHGSNLWPTADDKAVNNTRYAGACELRALIIASHNSGQIKA